MHRGDEFLFRARVFRAWAFELLAGRQALVFHAAKHAGINGSGDGGNGHCEVERHLRRPLAGALLSGLVENVIHQRLAIFRIADAEHLRRDLDKKRIQRALIPFGKNVGDLAGGKSQHFA